MTGIILNMENPPQSDFWERVDRLAGKYSYESLSKNTGIPSSTLRNARNRSALPKMRDGVKIADALGTTVEFLVTGNDPYYDEWKDTSLQESVTIHTPSKEELFSPKSKIILLPVLSQKISAGAGKEWSSSVEENGESLPVLERLVRLYDKNQLRVVEVRGDSMTGVHLFDGDLVIFVDGYIRGDGIYVLAIYNELYVKRLEFNPIEQKLCVISENPKYSNREYPADSDNVQICGKVVGWVHSHPH